MSLPVNQLRAIFTKAYMEKYKEIIPAPSFLKSFFNVKTYLTKSVGIEVQRGTERIAVDVQRGVDGNRNKWSLSTEKQFVPPFYNENFDATSLDNYDMMFGMAPNATPSVVGYMANDVAERLLQIRAKIERAKEYQCSQVFNTGVVTLKNGDNIDFKRRAESLVDLNAGSGGGYWSVAGTDIDLQLSNAGNFIRTFGKNSVKEANIITSGKAYAALKQTDWFKNTTDFRRANLMDLTMPQANANGGVYHGTVSGGAYVYHFWTYDEIYEDSTGTVQRYFPEDKAFVVPVQGTRFELAHAAVPAILKDVTNAEFNEYIGSIAAEYYINNYIDPKAKAHIFEMYSAPLAIPVTVDMIYTMKVL
jgi:hypothetical protein